MKSFHNEKAFSIHWQFQLKTNNSNCEHYLCEKNTRV